MKNEKISGLFPLGQSFLPISGEEISSDWKQVNPTHNFSFFSIEKPPEIAKLSPFSSDSFYFFQIMNFQGRTRPIHMEIGEDEVT